MRFAKVSTKQGGRGGEAGSGKQAITAVTISVVIMMSQSAVRRVPRCNCIGSVRLGCLIRGIAASDAVHMHIQNQTHKIRTRDDRQTVCSEESC